MIERNRFTWQLLILTALLAIGGLLIIHFRGVALPPATFVLIALFCALITWGARLTVSAGIRKGGSRQVVYTLAAIGGKFLAYIIFILIYWGITKNLTKPFIIAFFALYLVLTLYLVVTLYKLLKTN